MEKNTSVTSSLSILEKVLNRIAIIGDKEVDRERYYTPSQTAEIFECSVRTIDRMAIDGNLVRSEVRKRIFYKGEDIINSLENSRQNYL